MKLNLFTGMGQRTPSPLMKPSKGLSVTGHARPVLSEAPFEVGRPISGLAHA